MRKASKSREKEALERMQNYSEKYNKKKFEARKNYELE
jgi:hypothetical protein